jgi:hypothetical protein
MLLPLTMRVSTPTAVVMILFGFTVAAGARRWEIILRDNAMTERDAYIQSHPSELKAKDSPTIDSYLAKTHSQRVALNVLAIGGLIWAAWFSTLLRKNRPVLDD